MFPTAYLWDETDLFVSFANETVRMPSSGQRNKDTRGISKTSEIEATKLVLFTITKWNGICFCWPKKFFQCESDPQNTLFASYAELSRSHWFGENSWDFCFQRPSYWNELLTRPGILKPILGKRHKQGRELGTSEPAAKDRACTSVPFFCQVMQNLGSAKALSF